MRPWAKISFALLLFLCRSGVAQGFVNLDFEDANVSGYTSPGGIPTSNAIPGWTAYNSGSPQSGIGYNLVSLAGSIVSLDDTNAPSGNGPGGFGLLPIQGSYSVLLEGPEPGLETSAAIGQTGIIPATAKSLIFWGNQNNGNLQVTFNGQNIPFGAI